MIPRKQNDAGSGIEKNGNSGLLDRLHRRLAEACGDLWDTFVDPREPFFDGDGGPWAPLGGGSGAGLALGDGAPRTEDQLRDIRDQCRLLAVANEFAINGHENRISYVVGTGHSYRATLKNDAAGPMQLALDVQRVLDRFLTVNRWQQRQQEIVRRRDRDGEAFLRFFALPDGSTQVRFVDPAEVSTPPERRDDPNANFGIQTDPDDVETALAYYIDGQAVDAADIQHRKANVDDNVKRGLPLFYPVRKNLRRAEKLLRNMSTVAEIQAAIALIRKHTAGTAGSVQQFVADSADATVERPGGQARHFRRYAPGTILDAPAGLEYDFPAAGLDASNFITVLQAELRAVASRLVMPEFMLTSDASNANYSSTLVAEGPAMKMFARLQAEMIVDDLAVMQRVVRNAAAAGQLPPEAPELVEIRASPPSLKVRDEKVEADVNQIEFAAGILSPQTWSLRRGLDFEQEQRNIAQWRGHHASLSGAPSVTKLA